jgi:predicted metalloprotease with PDZ domain
MRALNADAQKGKSFKDEDLIALVERYSGASLHDFYQHYIAGTDSLPIDHYLQYMGLRAGTKRPSGTLTMSSDSSLVFETIDPGSPYADAQLQAGDTLIAIDGEPLTLDNADLFVNARHEQRAINLTIGRNGLRKTVRLDFGAVKTPHQVGPYEVDPNSTPLEATIRRAIAGGA